MTVSNADYEETFRVAFEQGVGRVVMAASALEAALGSLYAALLESPVAMVVAPGLGFEQTVQAIRTVLRARPEHPWNEWLPDLLTEANGLYKERNYVVHSGGWAVGFAYVDGRITGDPHTHHATGQKRPRWSTEIDAREWTPQQLHHLARQLFDVQIRMRSVALEWYEQRDKD